jgi:hypothetical protein
MSFIYKSLGFTDFYSILIPNLLRKVNPRYDDYLVKFSTKSPNYILGLKGGGSRKFTYMDMIFPFEKFEDGETIHYTLNAIDKINECIVIIISKSDNGNVIADINNISFFGSCPHVGHMLNNGGSFLLMLAINFIRSIKNKYNIRYIQLQDNAQKSCNKKRIKVWLLSTLKNGVPWYSEYGFKPFNTELEIKDELTNTKLIANKHILMRTKTSVLIEEGLFDDSDEYIKEILEKHKNNNIHLFFTDFLKNFDNCKYIEKIQTQLINKLLLFDMSSVIYFMEI